ncbi:hypothetical protein MaudCBS49596_002742 [Microsporum audouinii]
MRVVIAGNGDLARYIREEFTSVGHELVILTRSHKPQLERPGVTQFITDYTLESLAVPLRDSEVLISTIGDPVIHRHPPHPHPSLSAESEMQTFHTLRPAFYSRPREPIRKLLREQTDLEWTLVSVGWLADYVVPDKNRYIKEIGVACPINLANSSMVIPGTGNEPVDFA